MSKLERITVTMPEAMAAKLREAVDSGKYATSSEIVREALRDWSDVRERRAAALADLRAKIEDGLKGPFRDADEFFDEFEAELQAMVENSEKSAA